MNDDNHWPPTKSMHWDKWKRHFESLCRRENFTSSFSCLWDEKKGTCWNYLFYVIQWFLKRRSGPPWKIATSCQRGCKKLGVIILESGMGCSYPGIWHWASPYKIWHGVAGSSRQPHPGMHSRHRGSHANSRTVILVGGELSVAAWERWRVSWYQGDVCSSLPHRCISQPVLGVNLIEQNGIYFLDDVEELKYSSTSLRRWNRSCSLPFLVLPLLL